MKRANALPAFLLFTAVITAAVNLRAGIAGVAPVLGEIVSAFHASSTMAGVITGLPGVFFTIMGLAAVPIARKLGLSRTLCGAGIMILVGTAFRPWVNTAWLFVVLTAFVVAGIALANVLLPAWIKRHGGNYLVALMTVNTAMLSGSGAVGPLSALLFDGADAWRHTLFFWVWTAIAQVIIWIIVALRTGYDFPKAGDPDKTSAQSSTPTPTGSLWGSKTAIFLMLFFGTQSMNAYALMGYLPQVLVDGGVDANTASIALAIVGAMGFVGGLVMPPIISKVHSLTPYVVVMGLCAVSGYAGLILSPQGAPLIWAILLGIGGWAFSTALALIVASTKDPAVTARTSGFVQPIGYILSALGPFLIGYFYTPETPNWTSILFALLLSSIAQSIFGVLASRPGFVDDELRKA